MKAGTYNTRSEAIYGGIITVLDIADEEVGAGGYNVDAIANEVLGTIGEGLSYRHVIAVSEGEFWASVKRHTLPKSDDA
ncbi:hypothetical protein [Actinomyces howellii]|uniref:Uncharacterized protein n=1 Tax=Actinomyces howellii TaxID=52771 RepID=A0A3S4UXE4_9ACTO|nr:hypothetical protein [Actinomyces howellii]VEG28081.1 Uncharacterised protein [Actinomyces howellii]